jgi:hypothetical protein
MTSLMSASRSSLAHSPSPQQFSTISQSGPPPPSSSSSTTSSYASNSSPLTSLLHQKLTTNDSNINSKQSSSTTVPSTGTNKKKVLLNDIASGLANAVALAVSNAVSSVHHQIKNQSEVQSKMITIQQYSELRQQLETNEPNTPEYDRDVLTHNENHQQQLSGNINLRKRLSNISIEAAVATAVNRYLTTTIKQNQALTPTTNVERQLMQDENTLSVNN